MTPRFSRILNTARVILEYTVSVIIIIELLITALAVVLGGETVDRFGIASYLREHRPLLLYIALAAGFTLVILGLVGQSARSQRRASAAHQQLMSEYQKLERKIERHSKCEELFRVLAEQNAQYDKAIFHRLFVEIQNQTPDERRHLLQLAVIETATNIKDMLNNIEEMFTQITGNRCAACIQVIDRIEGTDKEEAFIKTIARDPRSSSRETSQGYRVRDNSIHRRIFIDGEEIVVIDDLNAAESAGKFYTSSPNWRRHYNAVQVTRIPPMVDGATASIPRATLCIDNKAGGFSDPICEHLARELVWRMATKLYRLEELEKERARLN